MRMLNRNPKRLSAEVFSSAQKQPKQNESSKNREENGSTGTAEIRFSRRDTVFCWSASSPFKIKNTGNGNFHAAESFRSRATNMDI